MKEFSYVLTDPIGLHARPAGLLAQTAKAMDSSIQIQVRGKSVAATKVMALMMLGAKQGDQVTVVVEGGSEEANAAALEQFFQDNL